MKVFLIAVIVVVIMLLSTLPSKETPKVFDNTSRPYYVGDNKTKLKSTLVTTNKEEMKIEIKEDKPFSEEPVPSSEIEGALMDSDSKMISPEDFQELQAASKLDKKSNYIIFAKDSDYKVIISDGLEKDADQGEILKRFKEFPNGNDIEISFAKEGSSDAPETQGQGDASIKVMKCYLHNGFTDVNAFNFNGVTIYPISIGNEKLIKKGSLIGIYQARKENAE